MAFESKTLTFKRTGLSDLKLVVFNERCGLKTTWGAFWKHSDLDLPQKILMFWVWIASPFLKSSTGDSEAQTSWEPWPSRISANSKSIYLESWIMHTWRSQLYIRLYVFHVSIKVEQVSWLKLSKARNSLPFSCLEFNIVWL